jgi:hypothetical protein
MEEAHWRKGQTELDLEQRAVAVEEREKRLSRELREFNAERDRHEVAVTEAVKELESSERVLAKKLSEVEVSCFTELTRVPWAYRYECVTRKVKSSDRGISKIDRGLYHLVKNVLESTSYLLPLASETSFIESYAKPSRAPTLVCLPCCAILAYSKVGR